MAESERLYILFDRLERSMSENHTDVVQRLTRLESRQHTPDDCSGIKRVETRMDKDEVRRRDASWKVFARELVRGAVAAIVAAITALSTRP